MERAGLVSQARFSDRARGVASRQRVDSTQHRADRSRVLRTSDLQYDLPEELIATTPAERRDAARLLVTRRTASPSVEHRAIADLPGYFAAGDVLVVNVSAVIPARFQGARSDTGGAIEGLYLGPAGDGADLRRWRVLLKAKRPRVGATLSLTTADGQASAYSLVLESKIDDSEQPGAWLVRAEGPEADLGAVRVLSMVGSTPLPPYILASRKRHGLNVSDKADRDRYQTVYANNAAAGSVAAPTAGLHFTPEILSTLSAKGVSVAHVTLHVGTGTFKPVTAEFIEQHEMHHEWCSIPPTTARLIRDAKENGRRIIAVGTTSARTLESFSPEQIAAAAESGQSAERWTNILITPGHRFMNLHGLMTNFHLPQSTLMAMVATLFPEGSPRLLALYADAVRERYRFYSYGDAMLILPA